MAGAHLWSGSYRGGYSPSGRISFQQSHEVGGTRYPWMTDPLPLAKKKKKNKGPQRVGQILNISEIKIQKPEEIEAAIGKKPIRKALDKIRKIKTNIPNSKNPEGERRKVYYLATNLLTCISKTENLSEERRKIFSDECLVFLGRKKEISNTNEVIENLEKHEKRLEIKEEKKDWEVKQKQINIQAKKVDERETVVQPIKETRELAINLEGKIKAGNWIISTKIAWSPKGKVWDVVSQEKDGWIIQSRKSTREREN